MTAIKVLHLPESIMSGRNLDCHLIDKDNSGSSNKMKQFSVSSRYSFENKEITCFSPEDKF